MRGAGQIPVDRAKQGDPSPLLSAKAALEAGEAVVIYPEGTVTRNPDSTPMRGKSGLARLALDAKVRVVPMASWGSQAVWQKSGKGSLKFGRPVWIKAGAPIDLVAKAGPDARGDVVQMRELTELVMDEISALVEDLRARYPKSWS